ncbi:hypothetical protein AAG906_041047 [Vitis piasezkii]
MNVVFNDIRDRMDRQDAVIASLHEERTQRALNARRQRRRACVDDFDDYHEDEFEDEEDQASLNHEGRFAPRGERRGRGFQRAPRWQDVTNRNLGNIKMKIPSFQGTNDPEVYLEWEKKVEFIFECHNYSEEKKVTIRGQILLKRGGMMRINKHSRIHCMFQLGLLLKQDPRRSKKHLMG